jgi:hypothetical protein
MRILTVAVLSAGLAFPLVVENLPRKSRPSCEQQSGERKREEKKSALKKVKRGLVSAALFLAEPEK